MRLGGKTIRRRVISKMNEKEKRLEAFGVVWDGLKVGVGSLY